MNLTLIIISLSIAASTLAGGLFAIYFKDKSHLITSFSAGAVLGLAFFDLLPESFELTRGFETSITTSLIALGFILYLVVDRLIHTHENIEEAHNHGKDHNHGRGILKASSLSIHSFMDGLGIGLAFSVSPSLGVVFTVAVLAHDFSDGINTASSILKESGNKISAFKWLIIDAVAPIFGIICSMFFAIEEKSLGLLIAIFTGFFIYIGASDLIPESYHKHPNKFTTIMTVLGMLTIFTIIKIF